MTRIRDILDELNPWWKGGYRADFREREIYGQIRKFMPLPQIISLTGLRRVGKTTIMLRIAEDAVKDGFQPRNVIYFSFDEFRDAGIRDIIREYEEMMEKDFRKEKHILLLDEIQKLDGWEDKLKGFYDAHGKSAKIVISGSESLFVKKKSRETLAGRIFEFKVEPLTFREFLAFRKIDPKPVNLYRKELDRLFNEFILTSGFPEMIGIKDRAVIRKYLKESIIEKIIYRDIPSLFRVKDVSLLESLLGIFMENPGQLVEISELAKDMKIARQTMSSYITCLERSFLLRKLYNYSRSRKKTERKLKKYYPAIISADLMFREDASSRSRVFEWFIVEQLKAEFFWRDPYKNEVDIVLADETARPVEVKYGKTDFRGLLAFMKKFKIGKGYVISPDREETVKLDGKIISVVPAFKFLLE